jgi:hypothetical protein
MVQECRTILYEVHLTLGIKINNCDTLTNHNYGHNTNLKNTAAFR